MDSAILRPEMTIGLARYLLFIAPINNLQQREAMAQEVLKRQRNK